MNEKEEMKTEVNLEPEWLMGNQINELAFCKVFLEETICADAAGRALPRKVCGGLSSIILRRSSDR